MERQIQLKDRIINVDIQKKIGVRNINLTIAHGKGVRISAPFFISDARIFTFLSEKQNWVFKQLDKISEIPDVLDINSKFFLGKKYDIIFMYHKGRAKVILQDEKMYVYCKSSSPIVMRKVLMNWYKRHARIMILHRLREINHDKRFHYNRIFIKNQKTLWGSCSREGNLNFNIKLVMMPQEILEYIVVHELVHLEELNHSKRFWSKVADLCPNYKKHERFLKNQGHLLVL